MTVPPRFLEGERDPALAYDAPGEPKAKTQLREEYPHADDEERPEAHEDWNPQGRA